MLLLAAFPSGCMGPGPIEAVPWDPPPRPAFEGVFAPNHDLESATLIAEGQLDRPEDVAVDTSDPARPIYAGGPGGKVVRIDWAPGKPATVTPIATLGGTLPLGLKFDGQGALLVANPGVGLQAVDVHAPGHPVTLLTDTVGDRKLRFLNDLDVAKDGTVYFSESSANYGVEGLGPLYAILAHRADGGLFAYDPKRHATRQLLDGLYFPNGVTVTSDQASVLVAETGLYAITRYRLIDGQREPFASNMPGIPDGIMSDGKGTIWVACSGPRSALLDFCGPLPWVRNLAARLPDAALQNLAVGEAYGLLLAYDEHGRPTRSLHDRTGRFVGGIANAEPADGKLYLGTIFGHHVGVVAQP
ncbi:MAG: Strictosidine synthase [Cyanobacteria bacterium RYN_339]|nr:Strictosidine synthase [Cyanobacteria bacterium RYN_339]